MRVDLVSERKQLPKQMQYEQNNVITSEVTANPLLYFL